MVEITQYMFKHADVAAALVKEAKLHDGCWQLTVSFGFGVANVGPSDPEMNPAAIIPVTAIGLQRIPKIENASLAVDAAVVNPAS